MFNFSKQIIKIAKKTFTEKIGMAHGRKKKEGDYVDSLYDLSRGNSEDFDAVVGGHGISDTHQGRSHTNIRGGGAYESEAICLMERHLVPVEVVQTGMTRFSFLLETSAPGTLPDPLLIAALLDLVNINYMYICVNGN